MRGKVIILTALYGVCACAYSSSWMKQMASYLRDASFGYYTSGSVTNYSNFKVELPEGTHRDITITGWYSHTFSNALWVTPNLFYTPDAVQYSNPDMLNGAWAHGVEGGTNINGAVSFNGFPFSTYTDHPTITNTWKWGVYTVDGWASNSITINLGGIDYNFGAGTFNRNCIAGGTGDCIISGNGLVSVGISKTPCHKFYQCMSQNNSLETSKWQNGIWTTNGFTFTSIRVTADGTNHVWSIKTRNKTGDFSHQTNTNDCTSLFSSKGIYQLWFTGFQNSPSKTEAIFDYRVFGHYLTDDELERVYQNGLQDVTRRGL